MRDMPIEISIGTVPAADQAKIDRAIDILVGGNLSFEESVFLGKALAKNWTIRVIVDELRERRGMVPVPNDFDWRNI